MIVRARVVVTMDGPPLENGAVAIVGNRITDVGSWPEIRARCVGEVTDLGEMALLPGLINAHCHLDYTLLRGAIPPQSSFADWIQAINERKASLTPQDYLHSINAGFAEAAKFGTTTVANLEAFPELIGRLSSIPVRTWWFAEMIDFRRPVSVSQVYGELETALRGHGDLLGGIGLAPHAPYTASMKLYAETAALSAEKNVPATTHLAESTEEMEMFRARTGALSDFMAGFGRPMDDCGQLTPVGLMSAHGHLDERWIVAHLNALAPEDFELLERGLRFHIAHCPRSHAYFGHPPFALQKLRELGFNICLGTDSLASNDDLSLFAEMRQLQGSVPSLRAVEILQMATVNSAAALGQEESLGRISPGYLADLVAVPSTGKAAEAADEIISFAGQVPWLMVNGDVAAPS